MIIRCGLLLLALNCVGTAKSVFGYEFYDGTPIHFSQSYSHWPSMYNGAKVMRLRKREALAPPTQPLGQSEGGPLVPVSGNSNTSVIVPPVVPQKNNGTASKNGTLSNQNEKGDLNTDSANRGPISHLVPASASSNDTVTAPLGNITENNSTNTISTNSEEAVNALNINNPGVVKRAAIVFGGFLLLAVAYFIFYRKKGDKHNANTNIGDGNQFRYGVLESEDRRSKMELSRVPLTMESDEEDDEDLEIFDLGRKNSQSYVNLQTKDEDLVFTSTENQKDDKETLLLEIEDGPSDTLINWSNNGNKSVL